MPVPNTNKANATINVLKLVSIVLESVRLIEKLADMIAERLFVRFPNLCAAEVEVAKIGVDVGYDIGRISTKIYRERSRYIK